jgi:hypothetical protein
LSELQAAILFPFIPALGCLLMVAAINCADHQDDDDDDDGEMQVAWSRG